MTILKCFPYALVVSLLALTAGVRAQSTAIEMASDEARVEFSSPARSAEMRIEIFAPSGELIFDSGAVVGQPVEWRMQNAAGERVADGVYLATVTVTDSSGKRRKRIEQLTVSSEARETGPTPTALSTIDGVGTAGKIAKFKGTNTIVDSIITETGSGRVGVATTVAPTAVLQVNGVQPPATAVTGTAAPVLLQTTGGQGGNTSSNTAQAGTGASIVLAAGNGGSATVAGGKRGSGGSITLQPGAIGGGGAGAAVNGSVLIAPSGVGNVAIGTNTALSRLTVSGNIQISGAGNGVKFPDGKTQTTAALPAVQHNTTLTGQGTASSLLGINPLGVTSAHLANGAVGVTKLSTTNVPAAGKVLTYNGSALTWATPAGGGGGVTFFQVTRTVGNQCNGDFTLIDNAAVNGNANAQVLLTAILGRSGDSTNPNSSEFLVYTGATAFGATVPCPANRWVIRGGDIMAGARFNVLVVN
ncbi:MAG TPA: hypothetical protein VGC87_05280 [Pyrinomonadaceae bacterium]|jgi:hypothetical protein